jgi:hypothetical protein
VCFFFFFLLQLGYEVFRSTGKFWRAFQGKKEEWDKVVAALKGYALDINDARFDEIVRFVGYMGLDPRTLMGTLRDVTFSKTTAFKNYASIHGALSPGNVKLIFSTWRTRAYAVLSALDTSSSSSSSVATVLDDLKVLSAFPKAFIESLSQTTPASSATSTSPPVSAGTLAAAVLSSPREVLTLFRTLSKRHFCIKHALEKVFPACIKALQYCNAVRDGKHAEFVFKLTNPTATVDGKPVDFYDITRISADTNKRYTDPRDFLSLLTTACRRRAVINFDDLLIDIVIVQAGRIAGTKRRAEEAELHKDDATNDTNDGGSSSGIKTTRPETKRAKKLPVYP